MNETKVPPKLRSKAPFWCRHTNAAGKLDCLAVPLMMSDTDLCVPHKAALEAARERFWNTPVFPKHEVTTEKWTRGPIWP